MCLLKVRSSCFISASYRLRLDHMCHAFFMIVAQHMGKKFDDLYIANENGYLKNAVHREEGKVITAIVENVHLLMSKNISEVVMGLMAALQCRLSSENEEDFPIYST